MTRRIMLTIAAALAIGACSDQQDPSTSDPSDLEAAASSTGNVGVNILLKTSPTPKMLAELSTLGTNVESFPQIKAVLMHAKASQIDAIRKLPYVAKATQDAGVTGSPVDVVAATDFANSFSTWDQDAINVTSRPFFFGRDVTKTGEGVYVAVLDTGLLDTWRQYFPEQRIASEYAKSFGRGTSVPEQPNKWEHDVNAHGTHVTSSILGYRINSLGINIEGAAPLAKVIPVKVLGQTGSGSFAAVTRGILYVTGLKQNELAGHPVIINMSLGGPSPDPVTEQAIIFAVSQGVIIVASAGNAGEAGMGYPGAYAPVISVAASGWVGQWKTCGSTGLAANVGFWWLACDVTETYDESDFYIAGFSSREKAGQQLDIAAPGSWVLGPYQLNSGKTNFFYLSGTSMASPHVAGVVALLAQQNPMLTALQAENRLKSTALSLGAGSRTVTNPGGSTSSVSWGTDATGAGLVNAEAALGEVD